jgi:hypothetical protein
MKDFLCSLRSFVAGKLPQENAKITAFFLLIILFFAISVFGGTAFGDDWKVTLDQLCPIEQSIRFTIGSDGEKSVQVKGRKDKDFRIVSESRVGLSSINPLRQKVREFQSAMMDANIVNKSSADVDVRYRVVYERNGVEFEIRWVAGQLQHDHAVTQIYNELLELANVDVERGLRLRPDSFRK